MVVGLLGNESPDSNRFTLVTPKSENDVRLQAKLGNQNPTGLPVGAVSAVMFIVSCFTVTAFAADGNGALTAVNNLSTFIFGLIRAIGLILTGFGVVQIGLSLKSHDPSQRANGFLTLAGGVIITFAKEILNLIIGS